MGVPKAIEPWVNFMSSITVIVVDDIIKGDQWETKEIEWNGETYPIHKGEAELSGKGFTEDVVNAMYDGDTKAFLKSKEFQEFPLYNPKLTVMLLVLPDEIYDEERGGDENRMEATHSYVGDVSKVKMGRLGKVSIFSKNSFLFKVIIPASYISNRTDKHQDRLFNELVPTVSHELTHSYQTYMQLLGGKETIGYGRETVLNMLPQNLKFGETPSWNYFLHLVYLSLSFEVNARVTELYYAMKRKGVKSNDEALKVLMASDPWDDYKQLKDFNAEKFIKEFDADIPEIDPFHEMMMQLMGKKGPDMPKNNDEMMKMLIGKWDQLIQDAQKQIKSIGIDIPFMDNVPQKAKENPLEFFKFFEKRFHKKAEGLKRKLAKVVSYAVQGEE